MSIVRGNVSGRSSVPRRGGAPAGAILPLATLAVATLALPAPTTAQVPAEPEAALHELVNRHRESVGCLPLRWHSAAASVAEARSADMIARRYFDHVTPDGRDVFDELEDAGVEARGSTAENIALTQAGAPSTLEMWRDSPSHRRSLDNCSYTHHGLGERGGVWTQILLAHPKPRRQERPRPLQRDGNLSRSEPASLRRSAPR